MCTVCGILEWFQVGFVLLTFVNGVMLIHLWLPGCLCPGVGGDRQRQLGRRFTRIGVGHS